MHNSTRTKELNTTYLQLLPAVLRDPNLHGQWPAHIRSYMLLSMIPPSLLRHLVTAPDGLLLQPHLACDLCFQLYYLQTCLFLPTGAHSVTSQSFCILLLDCESHSRSQSMDVFVHLWQAEHNMALLSFMLRYLNCKEMKGR